MPKALTSEDRANLPVVSSISGGLDCDDGDLGSEVHGGLYRRKDRRGRGGNVVSTDTTPSTPTSTGQGHHDTAGETVEAVQRHHP